MSYDLDYLMNLISSQTEENLHLDYKAADALKKEDKKTAEIAKDVSAFANSDGGMIIYGIREDPANKHLPGGVDPIDRTVVTKEWLEQIIQGRIMPRIDGVTITVISVAGDGAVYLVDIPKSNSAHQAGDKKYYKRFNFNSEPMFDYEIRDIMNRQNFPRMRLDFLVEKETIVNRLSALGGTDSVRTTYTLRLSATNIGKVMAKYVHVDLELHKRCLAGQNHQINEGISEIVRANNYITGTIMQFNPILPNLQLKLALDCQLDEWYIDAHNKLTYTIYADNAEPVIGEVELHAIPVKIIR